MKHVIYIADPEILSIPIVECNDPLIDIKSLEELAFGLPPENDLTAPHYTKIRRTVYDKLCKAQQKLSSGLKFKLYEGYRSIEVQKLLFDQEFERVNGKFPDWTHEKIFHETTKLVSPVVNLDGSINIPPHNTGGAIDIEIITKSGETIDMGMTAAEWISVDPEICIMFSEKISKEAQDNRKILVSVLESEGFVNYPNEWWHFSYGDRYWAYHQPLRKAIYGAINELNVEEILSRKIW